MKKKNLPDTILIHGEKYKKEYAKILKAIIKYDRIAIFRHINPDFDAFGSQLGLAQWIKDNFPNKEVVCLGDNHVTFTPRLVPEMDKIKEEWFEKPFLALIVDVSIKSRIADPRFKKATYKVRIDHHPLQETWGKVTVDDTSMAAASELVADMLYNFKGEYKLSKETAYWLYLGTAGDSGNFKYASTSTHTFQICGELTKTGIEVNKIYQDMFLKEINDLEVTRYVLDTFKITERGVAYYILDDEIQHKLNIVPEKGKENVNLFSNIEGINVWLSITEDKEDKCWRASVRSKETVINEVCEKYHGGGHKLASGATLYKQKEIDDLINDLDNLLK